MGRKGEKGRSCKIRNEKMEAMKAVKQMKKMAEMEMKNMMPRQVTWEMCKTASEPFTVALVAGQNSTYGRVQINYKGEWGTVCDDGFTDMEAKAVCKSAGMYGGRVMSDSEITPQMRLSASDQTKIWLDDVRCHEGTYLKQCCFNEFGVHNCSHDNDVFVACQPVPPFCGWLLSHTMMFTEFDMNRDMGCASMDDDMDNMGNMGVGNMGVGNMGVGNMGVGNMGMGNMGMGNMGMGNMGMGNMGMGNMMGGMGLMGSMDPMMMKKNDDVEELGKKMMPMCRIGTPFGMALVGGANATMGRLEILYNQQWGTVCNNSFTDIEAMAVCRSLGFHGGKVWRNPPESLRVTGISKPIWTGGVRCKKEAYFHQCCRNGWRATNCQHSQDVFIMCDPWPRECYKIRKEHEEKMKQKEQHEKAAECLGMSPEELEMMMMKKMEDNRKEEGMGMGGMGGMGGEKEMMMKMFEKLMMGMMGKDDMGGMGGIGGMGNIGCNKDKMKMKMMEMFMDMMGGKEGKGGMRDMGGCRYGGMGGDRCGGMGMCGMCGMGMGGTYPMIQYQNLMMMMQKMLQRMNGMGGGATPSDGPPMSTVSPTSDGPPMSTDSPRSDEDDEDDDDGNSHGRKRSSTPQMSTVPTPRSSNA